MLEGARRQITNQTVSDLRNAPCCGGAVYHHHAWECQISVPSGKLGSRSRAYSRVDLELGGMGHWLLDAVDFMWEVE